VSFYNLLIPESLELLINSLDEAPFDVQHIPTLFYLAENVLYTLRTDSSRQPELYLTTFKIQLLTVGRLTFARVYFHHLVGQLIVFDDLKSQLFNYLDGVSSHYFVLVHNYSAKAGGVMWSFVLSFCL